MAQFRFETLEIWHMAIDLGDELFDIADDLENRKLFRFAEQLRAAGMSMSNNISEGLGSYSDKDFANFLKFSRDLFMSVLTLWFYWKKENIYQKNIRKTCLKNLDISARRLQTSEKR